MQARGYSLVEMVVVISLISILLAIGTLRFHGYLIRYKTEAQTRMIYDELRTAQANALYQRRATRVKLYTDRFEVYSSALEDDSGVAPVATRILKYPLMIGTGHDVDFDERGVAQKPRSICLDVSDETGAVDSVVIGTIRLRIGKNGKVGTCNAENITTR